MLLDVPGICFLQALKATSVCKGSLPSVSNVTDVATDALPVAPPTDLTQAVPGVGDVTGVASQLIPKRTLHELGPGVLRKPQSDRTHSARRHPKDFASFTRKRWQYTPGKANSQWSWNDDDDDTDDESRSGDDDDTDDDNPWAWNDGTNYNNGQYWNPRPGYPNNPWQSPTPTQTIIPTTQPARPTSTRPIATTPPARPTSTRPIPTATPTPRPTQPSNPNQPAYMAVVNEWRDKLSLSQLSFSDKLQSNALKTVDDSHGEMEHELNPGSMGQVLAPGDENNFEKVFVGGWLCEMPSMPGLDGICDQMSQGWSYEGQTGHAEILTSPSYSSIGCALAYGIWGCDLA